VATDWQPSVQRDGVQLDRAGRSIVGRDLRSSRPKVVGASVALAGVSWLQWYITPHDDGLPIPVWVCLLLAANVALTGVSLGLKRRIIRPLQRYIINPPIRLLLAIGVLPLGYALIETTGRASARPRRTPVGNGLVGKTFWIVAEHGRHADYVRNIASDPRVRVKVRRGLRAVWWAGTAQVLDHDDPYVRQRLLARWHPLRALNAAIVRVMGTHLLTIRIDLDE
jgi:deazaflavin-dependent oxidoreductase (nitroreductase family)